MPSYKDEERSSWYCKFYYTDWTGIRKTKMKRGFKTKKEATAWEREFLEKQQGTPDMSFQALYDLYMEDMEHRLKTSTMKPKRYLFMHHIVPFFKDKPINQITPADIRKWQNKIMKAGLKETSQRQVYNQLNAILNYAVKYYDLPKNPCKVTGSIGKLKAGRVDFWTPEDFKLFESKIDDITLKTAFNTLYFTGVRCGELLALSSEDIDLKSNTISITKTYHRHDQNDVITSPKTAGSTRLITIPPFLTDYLKNFIGMNYGIEPKDRLFQITRYKLSICLKEACEASGIKPIRIHDIRHSHVSLLIDMGFSPYLIAERIGDSVDMVNNIYGHLYPNKHNEVANKLQELVSK